MENQDFVHLHVHTEFSLLEGAVRLKALLQHCKDNDIEQVAMTDNGVMFGAVDFYLKATAMGIKPIIGCEMYVVPDMTVKQRGWDRVILLCKDYEGYQNLAQMVSLSHTDGFYYKARIDLEHMKPYIKNLIAISPGYRGPVAAAIRNNDMNSAKGIVSQYKDLFGDDFYLGVQSLDMSLDEIIADESMKIGQEMGVELVATNDVFYLKEDDWLLRDALSAIQFGRRLDTDAEAMDAHEQYLKTPEEMAARLGKYPSAIENTKKIADQCNVEFVTDQVHLPKFECPDNMNAEEFLNKLVWEGVNERYDTITDELKERVEFELNIINKMQYPIYFLIIWDFLDFCRKSDIPVGPGRGSAAGSIVAYALDITKIDPIPYNLLFERFLNPERVSMPDIDLDFCIKRRGEVIEYIVQKYGEEHVAMISTFGTMQARAVVRDVGRVLDVPLSEVDHIAKLIPAAPGKYTSVSDALEQVPELKTLYDTRPEHKQLLDLGMRLEGFSRHNSTHAAGVVISRDPLAQGVPLVKNDGQVATQYTMGDLESIGLLKMDILGLRNLTVMYDAVAHIKNTTGKTIVLDELELEDAPTYEILCAGNTIGIFQLESTGMRQLIKDLQPNCFEDIIALLALYRPGPLGSGMVSDFISNKSGETEVQYDLPELEPILQDTYGMIVYQEQVMQIASTVGGFSLGQADMLRRAMGKKKKDVMDKMKDEFLEGAKAQDLPVNTADKIFELCYKFAEYGFNKSHSAAYALISYQTAYLKANYPVEYMTALLSSVIGNTEKAALYINECKDMGLEIRPPDINHSYYDFSMEEKAIRFGLGAIKNVGEGAIQNIIEARQNGPFADLMDVCNRVDLKQVNKRVFEGIIKCGGFDSIDNDRGYLMAILEKVIDQAQADAKQKISGQAGLFGESTLSTMSIPEKDTMDYIPYSNHENLRMEKEMTGLYITGHPLDELKDTLEKRKLHMGNINEEHQNKIVTLVGILGSTRRIITKSKKEMGIGELEDLNGKIDVLVFQNDNFNDLMANFVEDSIVEVTGRARKKDDQWSMSADSIKVLTDVLKTKQMHINIDGYDDLTTVEKMRKLCMKNRGSLPLFLHWDNNVILAHKKYWVSEETQTKIAEVVGANRTWIS